MESTSLAGVASLIRTGLTRMPSCSWPWLISPAQTSSFSDGLFIHLRRFRMLGLVGCAGRRSLLCCVRHVVGTALPSPVPTKAELAGARWREAAVTAFTSWEAPMDFRRWTRERHRVAAWLGSIAAIESVSVCAMSTSRRQQLIQAVAAIRRLLFPRRCSPVSSAVKRVRLHIAYGDVLPSLSTHMALLSGKPCDLR